MKDNVPYIYYPCRFFFFGGGVLKQIAAKYTPPALEVLDGELGDVPFVEAARCFCRVAYKESLKASV